MANEARRFTRTSLTANKNDLLNPKNLNRTQSQNTPKSKNRVKEHKKNNEISINNNNNDKNEEKKTTGGRKKINSSPSSSISSVLTTSTEDSTNVDIEIPETPRQRSTIKRKLRSQLSSNESNESADNDHQPRSKIKKVQNTSFIEETLKNFTISTKSFYSKKTDNIVDKTNMSKSSENDVTPKTDISTKSFSILNDISQFSSNNVKSKSKIMNKKIYAKKLEPKLGNKNVRHNIKRPKNIKLRKNDRHTKIAKKRDHLKRYVPIIIGSHNSDSENIVQDLSFSETDDDDDDDDDDLLNLDIFVNHGEENTESAVEEVDSKIVKNKKFFKSITKPSANVYKVLENIKATVSNGKVRVLNEKKKIGKPKISKQNFAKERAQVKNIIRQLSISPEPKQQLPQTTSQQSSISLMSKNNDHSSTSVTKELETSMINNENENLSNDNEYYNYEDFRSRIPYNTDDPDVIERQHLLLDFLITHNICTEENFVIFIADPDNHKEEAEKIIESLTVIVTSQAEEPNTNDIIENQNNIMNDENNSSSSVQFNNNFAPFEQSAEHLQVQDSITLQYHSEIQDSNDKDIKNESKKLFPIFYPGAIKYKTIQVSSTKHRRFGTLKAFGSDQRQIDAGQKDFGAKQCLQCGLLYTVHEPEEEQIHKEFHQSLQILRFKGWIDENIIENYQEWGADGRIIYVTDTSHSKHKDRLMDVMKIVDMELGFSSYIFPQKFTAYLAVRRQEIVGICLVQPLKKANKYICINNIDCCTEEEFDAKCGISRIWVSPLHRRMGIASKLILAVRKFTCSPEIIDVETIAFSAPTQDGKEFAKKITKRDDFLVYL